MEEELEQSNIERSSNPVDAKTKGDSIRIVESESNHPPEDVEGGEKTGKDSDPIENSSFNHGKEVLAQNILGDRFEILKIIGQGGMGSVYKAKDRSTGQTVALKLLKSELCKDTAATKRFEQEAQSLSDINNENIVSVYDYGVTKDGTPFLVMQYIEGASLDERIKKTGKLDEELSIDICLQVCNALTFAHEQNLVHRDIKPSNVLLANFDSQDCPDVLLADFGIAKFLDTQSANTNSLTQTGDLFGTPAYMSPEQCNGGQIDHRSDIYSFGCMLYEMLTGKQPFEGANAIQVAVKHISGEPDKFASEYPDGHMMVSLEQIVYRCMNKEADARYQSIKELVIDLNLVRKGKPVGYASENEENEDDSKSPKGAPLKIIGQSLLGVFCFYSLAAYVAVFLNEFSLEASSYSESGRVSICFLGIFILMFLLHPSFNALRKLGRRRTLEAWWADFIILAVACFFILSAILTMPIQFQIPAISNVSTILMGTHLVVCAVLLMGGFLISTKMVTVNSYSFIEKWIKRLRDPYYKPKRRRKVPMKVSRALINFLLAICSTCAILTMVFPDAPSKLLSMIGLMNARTNGSISIPLLNQAKSLNPDSISPYLAMADVYYKKGQYQNAFEALSHGLKIEPGNNKLLERRAVTSQNLKNHRAAIKDLNLALPDNEYSSGLLYARAKSYTALGEFEKAQKDLSLAIENDSYPASYPPITSVDIYRARGLNYIAQNKYDEAKDDFSMAIEKGSSYDAGRCRDYVLRAITYSALNQRSLSNKDLKEAVDSASYTLDNEMLLVKAYAAKQLGDKETYVDALKDAKEAGLKQEHLQKILFNDLPLIKLSW